MKMEALKISGKEQLAPLAEIVRNWMIAAKCDRLVLKNKNFKLIATMKGKRP